MGDALPDIDLGELIDAASILFEDLVSLIDDIDLSFLGDLAEIAGDVLGVLADVLADLVELLADLLCDIAGVASDILADLAEGAVDVLLSGFVEDIISAALDGLSIASEVLKFVLNGADLFDAVVSNFFNGFIEDLLQDFIGQDVLDKLWDVDGLLGTALGPLIDNAINGQFQKVVDNLATTYDAVSLDNIEDAIGTVVDSFLDFDLDLGFKKRKLQQDNAAAEFFQDASDAIDDFYGAIDSANDALSDAGLNVVIPNNFPQIDCGSLPQIADSVLSSFNDALQFDLDDLVKALIEDICPECSEILDVLLECVQIPDPNDIIDQFIEDTITTIIEEYVNPFLLEITDTILGGLEDLLVGGFIDLPELPCVGENLETILNALGELYFAAASIIGELIKEIVETQLATLVSEFVKGFVNQYIPDIDIPDLPCLDLPNLEELLEGTVLAVIDNSLIAAASSFVNKLPCGAPVPGEQQLVFPSVTSPGDFVPNLSTVNPEVVDLDGPLPTDGSCPLTETEIFEACQDLDGFLFATCV